MIDMVSRGRLVSGFVRGGGQEQLATGVNPAYNRERFEEAHDLIVQAWTQPGPVPLRGQPLPAPRGEPLGGAAAEAAPAHLDPRRAQQGDGDLGGAAALPLHRAQHRDRRDQEDLGALRLGRRGGRLRGRPGDTAATCSACHVAETEEKAIETRGSSCGCRASSPASPTRSGRRRRATSRRRTAAASSSTRWAAAPTRAAARLRGADPEPADHRGHAEDGDPQAAARCWRRRGRRSWRSGPATASCQPRGRQTCIRLLGQEVLPALRETAKELGLKSPFEAETPVSLQFSTDLKPRAVAAE